MTLNGNYMSEGACYQNRDARDMALVSLLRVAHKLFASASVIQGLPRLIQIRDRRYPLEGIMPFMLDYIDPPFLDAFRITTSFENLFKAELLDFGYVVHKIDKRVNGRQFKPIGDQQQLRPIRVSEIRRAERVTWRQRGPFTITSLTHETLNLAWLVAPHHGYRRSLRLSAHMIEALNFVRKQRNTVHFLVNDSGSFNDQVVEWYLTLRQAINSRLLPRYWKVVSRYPHLSGNPELMLNEI